MANITTNALASSVSPIATRDVVTLAMAVPANAITEGAGIKALDMIEAWSEKHAVAVQAMADSQTVRDAATSMITHVLVTNFTLHQPAIDLAIATIQDSEEEGAKARQQSMNDLVKVMLGMVVVQTDPATGKTLYVETDKVKARFGVGATANSAAAKKGAEARRNWATFSKKATTQALGLINDGFDGTTTRIDPKTKLLQLTGPKVQEVYGVNRDSIILDGKTPDGITHNLKHENSLKATRERATAAYTRKASAPPVTSTENTTVAAGSNVNASIVELVPRMIALLNASKDLAITDETRVQVVALNKVTEEYVIWLREEDNKFAQATERQAKVAGPKPATKAARKAS